MRYARFLSSPPPPTLPHRDGMKPKNPLVEMEKKAKRIKKIQFIANTILANGCYHTKEMDNQISVAEKIGNITEYEKEIIGRAWDMRSRMAHELLKELEGYLDENK